ncbi:MAG: DUF1987 domain-containing protein [Bacteroidales bacterium]
MDLIEHQPTAKTPYVLLDSSGMIKFRGRSIPENVSIIYDEIVEWMKDYSNAPAPHTEVEVEMEYLNSGTSKYMLKILKILKEIDLKGFSCTINWYYEEGDDDIMERGEYYASILDMDIRLIETE